MCGDSPKYSVASVIGYLKGKSAYAFGEAKFYAIAHHFNGQQRNFQGESFWERDYAVSKVGFELEVVRRYIREQESVDQSG